MKPPVDPSETPPPDPPSAIDPLLHAAFNAADTRSLGPPSSVLLSLLNSLSSVPRVLLRPAVEEPAEAVVQVRSDELPRGATGRYQLHGEIARGGMGIVVRGRDSDLGRDLAVKILLQGHRDNAEIVARFVEEAQIGGQLQHPGVVPVYELGQFEDGRPFFTMKLVKGKTLAALLAERKSRDDERRRFLGIFEQICQTLAYAHARGVIHRDLKPSNVMVGAFGEVQVMDWGLAKVLREGGVDDEKRARARQAGHSVIQTVRSDGSGSGSDTQAGSAMGTPAYMAPEQARGEVDLVDERADVFGLGAMLCELLTGGPPFTGSVQEAQRKARTGAVKDAVSRLEASGADAEVVRLAVKCLDAEPAARPRNAGEVAAEIGAHLQSVEDRLRQAEVEREAEKARAVEAEKARREAHARAQAERRARRATVVLGVTLLVAMAAGGGVWIKLKSDRDARSAGIRRDVHAALTRVAALREQAKAPGARGAAAGSAALVEAERARAQLGEAGSDPELASTVAAIVAELTAGERDRRVLAGIDAALLAGTARTDKGHFAVDRSVPIYRDALAEWGLRPGATSIPDAAARLRSAPEAIRREVLGALAHWVRLRLASAPAEGDAELQWLREVIDAADDDPWRRGVRGAWRREDLAQLVRIAGEVDVSRQPVSMLGTVASSLMAAREEKAAIALLERAWRRVPGDFWINNELGNAYLDQTQPQFEAAVRHLTIAVAVRPESTGARVNLANALLNAGRPEQAVLELEEALEMEPGEPHLRSFLGSILFRQGKREEGLRLVEETVRAHPAVHRPKLILADILVELGKPDEAVELLGAAAALASGDPDAQNRLGTALVERGRLKEAAAAFEAALQIYPQHEAALENLGRVLRDLGRLDESVAVLKRLVARSPKLAQGHASLADALLRLERADEALPHALLAVELDSGLHDGHHVWGRALLAKGRFEEALEPLEAALRLHPLSVEAEDNLGEALQGLGRREDALEAYEKALKLDPDYAPALVHKAFLLAELGRARDAVDAFQAGLHRAPRHPRAWHHLGKLLLELGRVDEGIAALERSIEIDEFSANVHFDLGRALADLRQRWTEAAAAFQKAVELNPEYVPSWNNLGHTLIGAGRLEEARAAIRQALKLDPANATAHFELGQSHLISGENAEAVQSFRESIRLDPEYPESHCNLGHALRRAGRPAEAVEAMRRGHELGSRRPGWSYPSADWVARCERLAALEARLDAVIAGEGASIENTFEGATMCHAKGRYADAVKLWERFFAARPEAADDLAAAQRYNAACSAARAGAGVGPGAQDPLEQARWRGLALGWLRADLALRRELDRAGTKVRDKPALEALPHWRQDRDLAGVRDEDGLARLPAAEAEAWRLFWADVGG